MNQRVKKICAGFAIFVLLPAFLGLMPVHNAPRSIGFFSPDGVSSDYVRQVAFSKVNISTPEKLRQDLALVTGSRHKVDIDLGPVIASMRAPETISRSYVIGDEQRRTKLFEPLTKHKVLFVPDRGELQARLASFLPLLVENAGSIGAIYLIDEPYLHGISKQELERIAADVRAIFKTAGLAEIRLGLIFASGMFDRDFARHISDGVSNYAAAHR